MTRPDRVGQYLKRRGCPVTIVKGGLSGLIDHWEGVVEAVAEGYDLTLDDYLNDMDMRDILEGALEFASTDEQEEVAPTVKKVDQKFKSLTVDCPPVWGEAAARENGHDPETQWWFFRRPKNPGPDFEIELQEAGLA